VSTWNLIREQEEKSADKDKIEDNSKLLSELQTKLAAQATSLAQRMQARDLDSTDAQAKEFSDNIKQAIAAMTPARRVSIRWSWMKPFNPSGRRCNTSCVPKQCSTTSRLQQQQQGQGGQGGQHWDSRDMAQIYELEMDLNKSQYEARNNASPEEQTETQDELEQKLKELARRQQQLATTPATAATHAGAALAAGIAEARSRAVAASVAENMQANQQSQQGQQGQQSQGQQSQGTASPRTASVSSPVSNQARVVRLRPITSRRNCSSACKRGFAPWRICQCHAQQQTPVSGHVRSALLPKAQRQLSGASEAVARGQQQAQQNS
jgi:hypothetical protein